MFLAAEENLLNEWNMLGPLLKPIDLVNLLWLDMAIELNPELFTAFCFGNPCRYVFMYIGSYNAALENWRNCSHGKESICNHMKVRWTSRQNLSNYKIEYTFY